MLGHEQLLDLLAFLEKLKLKGVNWKIITSSVPVTTNWRVNSIDIWASFLHERRGGVGVVTVSGDRYEFAATAFPPSAGSFSAGSSHHYPIHYLFA